MQVNKVVRVSKPAMEGGNSLGLKVGWVNKVVRSIKTRSPTRDVNDLEGGNSMGVKVGWLNNAVRISEPSPQKGI